jgi:hypothetical protein
VLALLAGQAGSPVDIRIQAIITAACIAPDDTATVSALIAALNERPTNRLAAGGGAGWNMLSVCHVAASELGGLARPGNDVVPALLAALKGSEPGCAAAVVEGLAKAGPGEREVVPAVIATFEGSQRALAAYAPKTLPHLELSLLGYFRHRSRMDNVALAAVQALQKLARPDNGAVAAPFTR